MIIKFMKNVIDFECNLMYYIPSEWFSLSSLLQDLVHGCVELLLGWTPHSLPLLPLDILFFCFGLNISNTNGFLYVSETILKFIFSMYAFIWRWLFTKKRYYTIFNKQPLPIVRNRFFIIHIFQYMFCKYNLTPRT